MFTLTGKDNLIIGIMLFIFGMLVLSLNKSTVDMFLLIGFTLNSAGGWCIGVGTSKLRSGE